ncbi:nuclear transport factor 2 family protein [Dysgonomonas sp. GY75]|uniref:YybH family protein n=1 Tax=Dysgonomonas sp. GY75 TaxID=2780419 RepID=UPI001883AEAB|nr:nuclear transport factor 2 family protein [Dysgonomonas sp. GY75]MBF0651655.1 nuclear transport factor 2 family protein [Dysgonomonas sp. GY75]
MNHENIATKIIALETAALEKWNNGNPSGYLELYTPDFTYFDPFLEKRLDGFDKIEALYEEMRGKLRVDKYEIIEPVVQATDEMAVLTYNLISYTEETVYKWNCTEVYKLVANEWKIIHNHWSLIKPV